MDEVHFEWSVETLFSATDSIFTNVQLPPVTEIQQFEPSTDVVPVRGRGRAIPTCKKYMRSRKESFDELEIFLRTKVWNETMQSAPSEVFIYRRQIRESKSDVFRFEVCCDWQTATAAVEAVKHYVATIGTDADVVKAVTIDADQTIFAGTRISFVRGAVRFMGKKVFNTVLHLINGSLGHKAYSVGIQDFQLRLLSNITEALSHRLMHSIPSHRVDNRNFQALVSNNTE